MHRGWLYAQTMVRFTVLASGSKGNCTVISGGRTRILLDAGLSCRELFRRMRLAGEEPETLDAIIITHEHSDHVSGLAVTARKLGIPVYFTEGTHRAWMRWLTPRKQMTYAQWVEQCKKQAAERQAEADAAGMEGEADETDEVEFLIEAVAVEPSADLRRGRKILLGCRRWSILRLGGLLRLGILRSARLRFHTMRLTRWGLFSGLRGCGWPTLPTWDIYRLTSRHN